MADAQKIGLEAVLDTKQFEKGVGIYVNGQKEMRDETAQTAKDTTRETEKAAQAQSAALSKMGLAFAAAGAAGLALVGSMAMVAARSEELGVILDVTAKNARNMAEAEGNAEKAAGLTSSAVQQQVGAVKELGITTQVASGVVSQLIRYNLDWKKSTDLARLAQDAATFSAEDSSDALNGIIHGITTLNPLVLRNRGILINLEQEYAKWAKTNNRTVTSLTVLEKQTIAFEAVLAQGPSIAGAYEASMETASKQMRSMKRDIIEVSEAFGQELLPFLSAGVGAIRDLLHVLRDMPAPLQATAAQLLGAGSALALVGGAAVTVIPKILSLTSALKNLAVVQNLASLGMLGPVGLIAGLVAAGGALALYAYNVEKAHREEASSLLVAADSYNDYIRSLKAAGLENMALTESLYNTVKATEDATDATVALAQAQDVLSFKRDIAPALAVYEKLPKGLDLWISNVKKSSDQLEAHSILLYQDVDAMAAMAREAGAGATEADRFAEALRGVVLAEQQRRDEAESWQRLADGLRDAADATRDVEITQADYDNTLQAGTSRRAKYLEHLVQQRLETERLGETQKEFDKKAGALAEKAAKDRVKAEDTANKSIASARKSLNKSLAQLEKEHTKRIEEILSDLALVGVELQKSLLEAERQYRAARAQLAKDMADKIADAERDLAQTIDDINRDLNRDLADLAAEYAQDVIDINEDLAKDLEDLEKKHADKLEKMREDHLDDMLDLEERAAKERTDILEEYADKVRSIEEKYSLEPPPPDFDDLRRELQKQIRELEAEGLTSMEQQERLKLLDQLEKLKLEELATLEESRDAELALLEEKLAQEKADREAAYQIELEALEKAHEEQKAELELNAANRLKELEKQIEREQEKLKKDRDRRIEDAKRQHAQEIDAIRAANAQQLAELDSRLAEEKVRLEEQAAAQQAQLEERLASEKANYAERSAELRAHYAEQVTEVNDRLAEEKALIEENLADELSQLIDGLSDQSEAFRDAYAEQLLDLDQYLKDRLEREARYQKDYEALFEMGSPSRWAERMAKNINAGYERGSGAALGTSLSGALKGFESSLGQLAAPRMTMPASTPPGPVSNSTTNSYQNSINLTANYAQQQSQASVKDDLQMAQMLMAAVPRRR